MRFALAALLAFAASSPARAATTGSVVSESIAPPRSLADRVDAFNAWFAAAGPAPAHVRAVALGGALRVGVVATSPIALDDVYLGVPTALVLDAASAAVDDVLGPVIDDLRAAHPTGDDLHEVVLHLLFEDRVRAERPFLAKGVAVAA